MEVIGVFEVDVCPVVTELEAISDEALLSRRAEMAYPTSKPRMKKKTRPLNMPLMFLP